MVNDISRRDLLGFFSMSLAAPFLTQQRLQTQSSDVFERSATCWGVSKGSFSRQSHAGTTSFGIV